MSPAGMPPSDAERFDRLRLMRCDNIGPRSFQALLARYGSELLRNLYESIHTDCLDHQVISL